MRISLFLLLFLSPVVALADTAFLDPDGDVASAWTRSSGSTNYTLVDDGTRQPTTPNNSDYVYRQFFGNFEPPAISDSTITDTYSMGTTTVGEVTAITIWAFGLSDITAGDGATKGNIKIGETWQTATDFEFVNPFSGGAPDLATHGEWKSVTYSGLSMTQEQLDALEIRIISDITTIVQGDNQVSAVYAEITYTAGSPAITVTNSAGDLLASDRFNFPRWTIAGETSDEFSFSILNTDSGTLTLTGDPIVSIDSANFTVSAQPLSTSIAPEDTDVFFTITFNPARSGKECATLSIDNNSSVDPYEMTVCGYGNRIGTAEDLDGDGIPSALDCDDTRVDIRPGKYDAEGCENGYRLCGEDGTYGSCVSNATTPLCEATTGDCYYIHLSDGDDETGTGSYAAPYQSMKNFQSYYSETDRNLCAGDSGGNYIALGADDFVYVMGTEYPADFNPSCDYGFPADTMQAFYFRGKAGTAGSPITIKAYPGHYPSFNTCSSGSTDCENPIHIYQSDWIHLEGLSARNGVTNGLVIVESDNVTGWDNLIEEINEGDFAPNNGAAVKFLDADSVTLTHSYFGDSFQASNPTAGNTTIMSGFVGSNPTLLYNMFEYTDLNTLPRVCYRQKHGGDDRLSVFKHNQLINCGSEAIAMTQKFDIQHNLIYSYITPPAANKCLDFNDQGGPIWAQGGTFSNNTCVGYDLMQYNYDDDQVTPSGDHIFQNNVIISDVTYGSDDGIIRLDAYSTDGGCIDDDLALFSFDNNCYYNENGYRFIACRLATGAITETTLAGWQSATSSAGYPQDASSLTIDPALNASYQATAEGCEEFGWYPLGTPAETITSGVGIKGYVRRLLRGRSW